MTETVSQRDLNGKHGQADLRALIELDEPVGQDDLPTEELPAAIEVHEDSPDRPDGAAQDQVHDATVDRPADAEVPGETGDDGRPEPRGAVEESDQGWAAPATGGTGTRASRPAGGRRQVEWRVLTAAAGLVVLGLVAWLAVTLIGSDGPAETPAVASGQSAAPAPAAFGEQVERPDDWTVAIDLPTVVRPGGGAELPAGSDRAVQLEVTLTNGSDRPRDSAGWTIKATADNRPVELLPADAAAAPSRTILPGASLIFPVVVPMPHEEVGLQMETGPAGTSPVVFIGPA